MVHAGPDRFDVCFDDARRHERGLVLPVTLGPRLGIEQLVEDSVDLGERPGAARPGRKVLSLVHAMLLGAALPDDPDRTGRCSRCFGLVRQGVAA